MRSSVLPYISSLIPKIRSSSFQGDLVPIHLAMNSFFNFFGGELGTTPAKRGLTPGQSVFFFANVSEDAATADTVTFSDYGTSGSFSARRRSDNIDFLCNDELDCVIVRSQRVYR